jgi:Rieske Fe-S protein
MSNGNGRHSPEPRETDQLDGGLARERSLGRRKLLAALAGVTAACGALGYALGKPIAKALQAAAEARKKAIVEGEIISPPVSEEGFVELPFAEYPNLNIPRRPYSVRLGRNFRPKRVLVWREPGGGEWRAISQECTHQACPVEMKGGPALGFFCPCHGSEFDRQGVPTRGPALLPLQAAPLEVSAQGLRLRVEKI